MDNDVFAERAKEMNKAIAGMEVHQVKLDGVYGLTEARSMEPGQLHDVQPMEGFNPTAHLAVAGQPPAGVRPGMSMEELRKHYPALKEHEIPHAPWAEPQPEPPKVHQITAGQLAKNFLVWQTNRRKPISKRELKKHLDKLWPNISGEDLWKRTKITWQVLEQLQVNGWMESPEAKALDDFDRKASMAAQRGYRMPVKR